MSLVICILIIAGTGLSWHWLWLAVPVYMLKGLSGYILAMDYRMRLARILNAVRYR